MLILPLHVATSKVQWQRVVKFREIKDYLAIDNSQGFREIDNIVKYSVYYIVF